LFQNGWQVPDVTPSSAWLPVSGGFFALNLGREVFGAQSESHLHASHTQTFHDLRSYVYSTPVPTTQSPISGQLDNILGLSSLLRNLQRRAYKHEIRLERVRYHVRPRKKIGSAAGSLPQLISPTLRPVEPFGLGRDGVGSKPIDLAHFWQAPDELELWAVGALLVYAEDEKT